VVISAQIFCKRLKQDGDFLGSGRYISYFVIYSMHHAFFDCEFWTFGHFSSFNASENGRKCNLGLDQLIVCVRMRIAQGAKAELVRSDWPFLQACIKEAIQECETGIWISRLLIAALSLFSSHICLAVFLARNNVIHPLCTLF
jgi:hypothetical protein